MKCLKCNSPVGTHSMSDKYCVRCCEEVRDFKTYSKIRTERDELLEMLHRIKDKYVPRHGEDWKNVDNLIRRIES